MLPASSRGGQSIGSAGRAVITVAPATTASATSKRMPSPAARRRISRGAFQALQRFEDFCAASLGLLALFLLALDDLLGGFSDKVRIAKLSVDALDVRVGLGDLLLQPGLLGRDVDDALERQRRNFVAHQKLHRAWRR